MGDGQLTSALCDFTITSHVNAILLINSLHTGELIHRIVTLEDIAAESAVQISTIFSLVEERVRESLTRVTVPLVPF